jgi:hypothetical protein
MNSYYRSLPENLQSLYNYLTWWKTYTHSEAVQEIERRRG